MKSIVKNGFTLIEVTIVILLTALVMIVIVEFFFGTLSIYRQQEADLILNNSARTALDDIDANVRSSSVTLTNYLTYNAGPDTLIVRMPSIDAGKIIIPGTYDTVVFYLIGTNLFRDTVPDPASSRLAQNKLLAENVSSLTFNYDNADFAQVTTVQTDLSLLRNTGKEIRTLTLSSKSRLRN